VASNYIIGLVSNGYAERTTVKAYGQYGIGQTMYPVNIKTVASNGMVKINPNPYTDRFNVSLTLPTAMNVKINIYDQAGRLVKFTDAGIQSGTTSLEVQAADLPEGAYTVVVTGNGSQLNTTKLIRINR
jgi:flagellar hook assembly protein FlgD